MSHEHLFEKRIPDGEDRERLVCNSCGFINYVNPKLIVGAVCTWEDKLLICKRAIEPRHGYWTIPAGFMEEEESTEEGAKREVYEEALADVEIGCLLGVYNVPRLSQVHLIYRATLKSPDCGAGPESLDAKLIDWDEIPWDQLAFPSVYWALKHHQEVEGIEKFAPFTLSAAQVDWNSFLNQFN
jgi:ADP-ribose pyrophosphatase YjhB (NUDIX family)